MRKRTYLLVMGIGMAAWTTACGPEGALELPEALATAEDTGALLPARTPRPEELKYGPPSGNKVALNPPTLTWVAEPAARSYEVQLWQPGSATRLTVPGLRWQTYTHHTALADGSWNWRFRYLDTAGAPSEWSQSRGFVIVPGTAQLPLPSEADRAALLSGPHPRLFFRDALQDVRAYAAANPNAADVVALRKQANYYSNRPPLPAPAAPGWAGYLAAKEMREAIEAMAFADKIFGLPAHAEGLRRYVLALASWDPNGATSWLAYDYAGKEVMSGLSRGYDWGWARLSEAERAQVRTALSTRMDLAWSHHHFQKGKAPLSHLYSSHLNNSFQYLGEAAIALYGEVPEAVERLDLSLNKWLAAWPNFNDADGGYSEGVHYGVWALANSHFWVQEVQAALGMDALQLPYYARALDAVLYLASPGSPNAGMEDLSYQFGPSFNLEQRGNEFFDYYLRALGNHPNGASVPKWRWYGETRGRIPVDRAAWQTLLFNVRLPPPPPAQPPTDWAPSRHFRGTGVASLHTSLVDAANDVHFQFKSSPRGTISHGFTPQNAFQLTAYGETLLRAINYRTSTGDAWTTANVYATSAHNAVLVNDQGQGPRSFATVGRIETYRSTLRYDFLRGDATAAYQGRLTRALRSVAFVKPDLLVLLDEVAAPSPSTYQFMLHADQAFAVDAASQALSTERPLAGVDVRYLAETPLSLVQTQGYTSPKPSIPDMFHLRASTQSPAASTSVLTVMVPYRTGTVRGWTATRVESATAVGIRFVRGAERRLVGFRRAGVTEVATLDGATFDDAVVVR